NVFVGIPVSAAVFGAEGLASAAIAIAIMIPGNQFMCVLSLVRYGAGAEKRSWKGMALEIAKNPLILACVGGIALNLSGFGLPPGIDRLLDLLGRAAAVTGLLAVGAGLEFRNIGSSGAAVLATSAMKLVLMPAMAAGLFALLGSD